MEMSDVSKARRRERSSWWLVLLVAVLLGAVSAPANGRSEGQSLAAELTLARDFSHADSVVLRFELRNQGPQTVQVLHWGTPFEGHRSWIFEVECEGRSISYRGPTVKRSHPRPEHYIEIPAGESRSTTIDLSGAYPLPASGACSARWTGSLQDVVQAETAPQVESRALTVTRLPEVEVFFTLEPPADVVRTAISFVGCTSAEQQTLRTALPKSEQLAQKARDDLQGVAVPDRPSYQRYRTWFGVYDASRYTAVTDRYGEIQGAAGGTVKLDCTGSGSCGGVPASCDSGDYAFTCSGGANQTIWLCGGFWRAPATGQDSQAGTLVHELSHWFGTQDFAYTCSRCQDLAAREPANAVDNGDNTEYFAEDFGLECP